MFVIYSLYFVFENIYNQKFCFKKCVPCGVTTFPPNLFLPLVSTEVWQTQSSQLFNVEVDITVQILYSGNKLQVHRHTFLILFCARQSINQPIHAGPFKAY